MWVAGLSYFAIVFGTGFVLGVIRVLWVAPAVGDRTAELAEMPIMLLVMVVAARWVVHRFRLPPDVPARLGVGLVAVCLMLLAEFGLVLPLRGVSLEGYFAQRDPVTATGYYLSLAVLAFLPVFLSRR
ncbi:MAG: hypothetical protein P8080_12440 [Gammaproteobacteria bacterium]